MNNELYNTLSAIAVNKGILDVPNFIGLVQDFMTEITDSLLHQQAEA